MRLLSKLRILSGCVPLAVLLLTLSPGLSASACDMCRCSGLALCSASTDAPQPSGFQVSGNKWPQSSLGSPVTITYSYNNLLDGGLKDPDGVSVPADFLRTVIEEALGVWAEVAPLHFIEVEDEGRFPRLQNYPDGQYGQIRFSHLYMNGPDIPGQGPKSKAQAFFPTGNNIAGDVFFDHGDPWAVIGELDKPDVLGAAIHEIGHSLGLHHSSNPDANMYWIFQRHTGPGSGMLHADDIAGVQTIYGSGVGSVRPLSAVPEPSALVLLLAALPCCSARRR